MQKSKKRDPPNTIRCPYIPQHLMHIQSFLTHLTRCKATNKTDFKVCPFNSYHIVHKDKFNIHMERCNEDPEDENEWECRAIQRGFIAGCGGQDPSGFRDEQSSIHQAESFFYLTEDPQNSKEYEMYKIVNSRMQEEKRYTKKQKIDYNYKMVTYRRNEPNDKQFNRNFYDLSNLSNYYVKESNRGDYGRGEEIMEENQYYKEPYGNNYQNGYNFTKKQTQQPYKQAWNKNQRQWGPEDKNYNSKRIEIDEQRNIWEKQAGNRKKKPRADDDELIFWIDQIDKNIKINQVASDSGNDEFGNILAQEASFIRKKGQQSYARERPETANFNQQNQNVKNKMW